MNCSRCHNPRDTEHSYCRPCKRAYETARESKMRDGTWEPWSAQKTYERFLTPRAWMAASTRDIAWAAGFLEGEGTFRSIRQSHHVSAGQVNPEPLKRLQNIFGGRITTARIGKNSKQPCATWYVCGARARGVMFTVFTLLTARRREQVRVAMSGGY